MGANPMLPILLAAAAWRDTRYHDRCAEILQDDRKKSWKLNDTVAAYRVGFASGQRPLNLAMSVNGGRKVVFVRHVERRWVGHLSCVRTTGIAG